VALAASALSFRLVENPIRNATFGQHRRWVPVGLGLALIALSVGVATVELAVHSQPEAAAIDAQGRVTLSNESAAAAGVRTLVRESTQIRKLPADLSPTLGSGFADWGGPPEQCFPAAPQSTIPACVFGDRTATRTMVLYGDSHAGMWFETMNLIAQDTHWKLVDLAKGNCPAVSLPYENPPAAGPSGSEYAACDAWHRFALRRIRQLHPDLVVITQEIRTRPNGKSYTPEQWQVGLEKTFSLLGLPTKRVVVLGNLPILPKPPAQCLSLHPDDVQACSGAPPGFEDQFNQAEAAAAAQSGIRYVDVNSWFCAAATKCSPVIGKYQVYIDDWHVTATYSVYLARSLRDALHLSGSAAAPTTSVLAPSNDTSVSGVVGLNANASDSATKVEFRLTGGTWHDVLIGTAAHVYFGWFALWNSAAVPNGTYTLRSDVADTFGDKGVSAAISVTVGN
jgi:hypothetical protein